MPHAGGDVFGAARLAHIVATIQARLEPGQGLRLGRPTDASGVRHPKVPMSGATRQRLARLAEQSSIGGRKGDRGHAAAGAPVRWSISMCLGHLGSFEDLLLHGF
jgi:hypothetical protein